MTASDIKTLRAQLGLTQSELATRLNRIDPSLRTSASTVSRWETDPRRNPSARAIAAMRQIENTVQYE